MHGEQLCLSELVKVTPITLESLRREALSIFTKRVVVPRSTKVSSSRRRVLIYLLKCEKVYQYIVTSLGYIARLPRIEELQAFYAELINIASKNMYNKVIEDVSISIKILSNLWSKYRKAILSSAPTEAKKLAREFVGRSLSILHRKLKMIDILDDVMKTARVAPCIDFKSPIIIISGMPQVGKSTLVGKISSAKTLVSPYPFTTKNIVLGHIDLGHIKIQVIDTPGLLDRSIDEMNEIERKAVAALKYLNSITLYLFDSSPEAYYSFGKQLSLLKMVEQLIGKDRVIPVFNKIDKAAREHLSEFRKMLELQGYSEIIMISALHGVNINELIREAIRKYDRFYGTNYSQFLLYTNFNKVS
ncbi:MAG: 50S ribosome-binding GTPase [Ignisphaera sp.]|nr:50S ribosome-binding GTPase [Ignisphaera sp.]MCX8167799.1 50S ribosome-binding GTPase [Ignisphaera sp.]MDW8086067.1 GTPase [Ignisphaera sp.]